MDNFYKRFFRVAAIFMCLAFAIQAAQFEVKAEAPTLPVSVNYLNLSFVVPSYVSQTYSPRFSNNNCAGFVGDVPLALVQVCRFSGSGNDGIDPTWQAVKQSTIDGTTHTLISRENEVNDYTSFNGIFGEVGVFFYQGEDRQMGVVLFVGKDGNDMVAIMYQVDTVYSEAPTDGYNVVRSISEGS